MALVLINSFVTDTNIRVEVNVETSTGTILVQAIDQATNVSVTPPATVTVAERGASAGTIIWANCIGFDFYRVQATLADPFAEVVQRTQNSSVCGFTTCDIVFTGISTQSPSFTNASDGRATIAATSSNSDIEYSLDGINWQSRPEFTGLIAGNYLARIRDANGCTNEQPFTITESPNPFPEDTVYPWRDKVCRWFRLKQGNTLTTIREPIKWDAIGITGERDAKWHGWNWQYSDGEVQLEFDCPAGKDVLDAAFEAAGNDAELELLFGYTKDGQDYQLYQGKFDFNTYKRFASHVSCTVIRKDNMDLLQSRFEEKFTVTKDETFGGEPIVALPGQDITLHGKVFKTGYLLEKNEVTTAESVLFDTGLYCLLFDTTNPQQSEIDVNSPTGATVITQASNPYNLDYYLFKLQNDGQYIFDIEADFFTKLSLRPITGIAINETYTVSLIMALRRFGVVSETVIATASGTIKPNTDRYNEFDITHTPTLQLQTGDEIFFFVSMTMSDNRRSRASITINSLRISIDATEIKPDSQCRVWWLGDVARYGVAATTDNQLSLKSRLIETAGANFGTDGPFSLYMLTNGYNIRRFIDPLRPLVLSLKDLFDSLNAMAAAGMGLEKQNGQWTVRLEPLEYFYRNVLILYIEEVESYDEEVARDLLYNAVGIGYEKYEEDGIQQLDEFNTRHEYSTPIKSHKNKLEKLSKLVAGGYTIEKSRRNQFSETGKDTVTNDEDAFVISVRKDGAAVIPEKDEAFSTVANVISPETSYNLRLSPKRLLLNWWRWLRSSLFYKEDTELVRNTFFDRNGELQTQFDSTEPNPMGDYNRALLTEKADVAIANLGDPAQEPIYRPEWVNVKCRLNPDQVDTINKAMNGADTQNRNYGYLMVRKPNGQWQAFWLYKMRYSYVSEQCELRGLKKWSTPPTPIPDCCAWLVANGCYVKANGNRLIP